MTACLRLLALTALALALASFAARAEGPGDWPAPRVTWQPAEPDIGDLILLHVDVEVPERMVVTFPRLDRDLVGMAVSGRLATRPEQAITGLRRWRQTYRLEPQATGRIALPPIVVVANDPGTMEEARIVVDDVAIAVRSLAAPDADFRRIRDVQGVLPLPAPPGEGWLWLGVPLVSAVLLGALAIGLFRRRAVATPAPGRTPAAQALAALRDLGARGAADNQRFHGELARILRDFVRAALAVDAIRRTTSETVAALRRQGASSPDPDLLARPLGDCDRVKFARAAPDDDDRGRSLAAAIDFVARAGAR